MKHIYGAYYVKHCPTKLFHLIVIILTILHAASAFSEEIPFKLSYGETENKLGTQINLNAGIPERAMRKTISLVSLKNGLIIKGISVNKGNMSFLNRAMPLPVSLNYGQQYDLHENIEIVQPKNEAEAQKMLAALFSKSQVIDIAVALGNGRTFLFEVGTNGISLTNVRQNTTKQSISDDDITDLQQIVRLCVSASNAEEEFTECINNLLKEEDFSDTWNLCTKDKDCKRKINETLDNALGR